MDQIVALPARTLTVTMACAGNRRKEQNMHRKSQGFNWGAAGVSTAMWTGVPLRDLLLLAGLDESDPLNATRHLRFCGPAGELPKGGDGRYGSSIALPYALNPAHDVLVAYKQNGRWLAPDHGFPVRLILPGFIGGRTVKWLERIEVSDSESDNWYHLHDNRVLPPHVRTPEDAEAGGFWRNPDYVINHLNINSAISSPSHDAVVPLRLGGRAKVPFRGYAYSGGGRKVTRVELSLDGGRSWPYPALIHRGEPPTRHGMHWAWVRGERRESSSSAPSAFFSPSLTFFFSPSPSLPLLFPKGAMVGRNRLGGPAGGLEGLRRRSPPGRWRGRGARDRAPRRRRVDELPAREPDLVAAGHDGQPALPRQDARPRGRGEGRGAGYPVPAPGADRGRSPGERRVEGGGAGAGGPGLCCCC